MSITTVKLRLKDKHRKELIRQGQAMNLVWNYCNEVQIESVKRSYGNPFSKWTNFQSLQKLTAGMSQELGVSAASIQMVCQEYDSSRREHKKAKLKWRGEKSLGWIPISQQSISFTGEYFVFMGEKYYPMHLRPELLTQNTKILSSSFNQDSQGHWYINVVIEIKDKPIRNSSREIGVDLGLKTFAVTSDGEEFKSNQYYRRTEKQIGKTQRAGKKKKAKKLHNKIKNQRKDSHHKLSSHLINNYDFIAVGDVNSKKLARTNMAKSVYDAAWSMFRNMLRYKSIMNGVTYLEVNERNTTQTCSLCGCKSVLSPKGIEGLRIREWICDACGAFHDRDVNAARNILRLGLQTRVGGANSCTSGNLLVPAIGVGCLVNKQIINCP